MAIVTIDAGRNVGAIVVECWKHGIEVEKLSGNQLELTSAYDDKLDVILNRFSPHILHKELIKEASE